MKKYKSKKQKETRFTEQKKQAQMALFPSGEKPTPEQLILAIHEAILDQMVQKQQSNISGGI